MGEKESEVQRGLSVKINLAKDEEKEKEKEKPFDEKFELFDGLTPPTHNIRKRRFRKVPRFDVRCPRFLFFFENKLNQVHDFSPFYFIRKRRLLKVPRFDMIFPFLFFFEIKQKKGKFLSSFLLFPRFLTLSENRDSAQSRDLLCVPFLPFSSSPFC